MQVGLSGISVYVGVTSNNITQEFGINIGIGTLTTVISAGILAPVVKPIVARTETIFDWILKLFGII